MAQTIVRCSKGHLYTTKWVPMTSFKAIRLGRKRAQRCPVCGRMRMTEKVDVSALGPQQRREAEATHDSGVV